MEPKNAWIPDAAASKRAASAFASSQVGLLSVLAPKLAVQSPANINGAVTFLPVSTQLLGFVVSGIGSVSAGAFSCDAMVPTIEVELAVFLMRGS